MDQALKLWEERMRAAIKEGREGICYGKVYNDV